MMTNFVGLIGALCFALAAKGQGTAQTAAIELTKETSQYLNEENKPVRLETWLED